jgi:hypothetical protein
MFIVASIVSSISIIKALGLRFPKVYSREVGSPRYQGRELFGRILQHDKPSFHTSETATRASRNDISGE